MLAYLWLWLGRWVARRGLDAYAEILFRSAASAGGSAGTKAWFELGQLLLARKCPKDAAAAYQQVVAADPHNARAWCALGIARRRLVEMPAARSAYAQALAIDGNYPEAQVNLAEWHLFSGEPAPALSILDEVLSKNPEHHEALANKIAALNEAGRHGEAEAAALAALRHYPDSAALQINLGNVYVSLSKPRDAAAAYARALELNPASEEAALNRATLLGTGGFSERCVDFLKEQIQVRGETPERLLHLASVQIARAAFGEAKRICQRILVGHPDYSEAFFRLSVVADAFGENEDTMTLTQRYVALNPENAAVNSNIPYEANSLEQMTRQEVFALHREWATRHEAPLLHKRLCQRQPSDADSGRRLRIGYVSADFFLHPVGILLRDILRHHDKSRFEIWCYSQLTSPDFVTEQIKLYADHWLESFFLGDTDLANRIVADQIDILIDLSGHTGKNRLRVFAMRPAPILATWLGYYHSTGLSSIDYFITDPYSTPPQGGQLFSEQPVYLPSSRFCYSPPNYAAPVAALPCERNGHITFGSFNRLCKLTPKVVEVWSSILTALPESRLILKAKGLHEDEAQQRIHAMFARHAIMPERLELRGPSNHQLMYEEYRDIDIALDPFPFNGGMTTMDAMWMGVPVIALRGNTVVSLQSTSLLTNVGMQDLVFADHAAYIQGALILAGDRQRLAKLRRELRMRMRRSKICQPEEFAHELEFLFSRMWRAWNEQGKLGEEVVPAPEETKCTVLHVGCGEADRRSLPEYFQGRGWREVRLDINPDVLPDVLASMLDMAQVADASVDAVFSSHNIEHLHPHEVPVALREFHRVLKLDGILVMACPDLRAVCELVAEDKLDESAYVSPMGPITPLDMLYGHRASMAGGNLFMAHKTGFTATTLEKTLRAGGFESCSVRPGTNFDLMAVAYPAAQTDNRVDADMKACWPTQSRTSCAA